MIVNPKTRKELRADAKQVEKTVDSNLRKMKGNPMPKPYRPYTDGLLEDLADPEKANAYLSVALREYLNAPENEKYRALLALAMKHVAQAHAKSELAKPCHIPCPKCGSTDVTRAYFEAGDSLGKSEDMRNKVWSRLDWLESDLVACRVYGSTDHHYDAQTSDWYEALGDLIKHRCQTCLYEWATPPLKNEESEE